MSQEEFLKKGKLLFLLRLVAAFDEIASKRKTRCRHETYLALG